MLMLQFLDGHKFMTFLYSCDLKQLVNQPTHLHGHILDLILSPSDQDTIIVDAKIYSFVSNHALVKCSIAFLFKWLTFQTKFNIEGTTISTCLTSTQISKMLSSPSLLADAVVDLYEQYVHD